MEDENMEHSHMEEEVLGIHNQGVTFSHRSEKSGAEGEEFQGPWREGSAKPPRLSLLLVSWPLQRVEVSFPAWTLFSQVTQQLHPCGCNRWISRC